MINHLEIDLIRFSDGILIDFKKINRLDLIKKNF